MTIIGEFSRDDRSTADSFFLSTTGRVLLCVAEDPGITQVAMSIILGVSESAIEKSVAKLMDSGIIIKNKIGRNNVYSINMNNLDSSSDFRAIRKFFEHQAALSKPQPLDFCQDY